MVCYQLLPSFRLPNRINNSRTAIIHISIKSQSKKGQIREFFQFSSKHFTDKEESDPEDTELKSLLEKKYKFLNILTYFSLKSV